MFAKTIYTDVNLALFATANVQTTLLNSVGNDLSPEMRTYYEDRLIDLAEPNLVHDQFGEKYPIPRHGGKTINFRKFSPLAKATTPLTEGVTPDGQKLDVDDIEGTVSQYGGYVTISDILDLTAVDPMLERATRQLGSQAGRTLDTITREVVTAGTNVMYAPKADGTEILTRATVDKTSLLTVPLIFKAVAKLRSMNAVPIDDCYVAVVHPNVACDLMLSDDWIEVHKYATPENIYNGEIGKIGGVRFVQSTEAKIISGAGAAATSGGSDKISVYCTMVFAANAFGVTELSGGGLQHIVKQLGSAGSADPLNQRATTGWKATKTAVRLVEEYMVRIEHASATSLMAASN
jgi:N4-gp56 family major capsid protein